MFISRIHALSDSNLVGEINTDIKPCDGRRVGSV
jgi:hypothetical protein